MLLQEGSGALNVMLQGFSNASMTTELSCADDVLGERRAIMDIPAPKCPIDHPAYNIELQEALDYPVLDFVDPTGAAGWNRREAFKALAKVIRNQALAYEHDPDPDDDAAGYRGAASADQLVQGCVDGRNRGP